MKLTDLVRDPRDGSLSSTKLWTAIGLTTTTFAFIWQVIHAGLTADLLLVYGGLTSAHYLLKRYVDKRAA